MAAERISLSLPCRGSPAYTGVWRDLGIQKRKTEIDWQIGVIIRAADEQGIEVPRLKCLKRIVEEIEDGSRRQSWGNLRELADA